MQRLFTICQNTHIQGSFNDKISVIVMYLGNDVVVKLWYV